MTSIGHLDINKNYNHFKDKNGKILTFSLKDDKHYNLYFEEHVENYIEKNAIQNPRFFRLFHPEERIVRKNPLKWFLDLYNNFPTTNGKYILNDKDLEKIAVSLNQISFILAILKKYKEAEYFCDEKIKFFIFLSQDNYSYLSYAIQPWINIGRLGMISCDFNKSTEIFNSLRLKKNSN